MAEEKKRKKRKVGRPKKRGPKKKYYKKKKKKTPPKPRKKYNYKIVQCKNGKQSKYIGIYHTIDDANNKINELIEESNKVIFPIKIEHNQKITKPKYEYLLLERNDGTKENPMMRNQYGKMVEQKLNTEKWVILDKKPFEIEETFWVWGYDNRVDRKTFEWIFYNILIGDIVSPYDIKRVLIYKNKVIIKDDANNIDMIICKLPSDAIRFYNLLQTWVKARKLKQIFFIGSYNKICDKRRMLEKELIELTGWPIDKIQMISTTKHIKN